jgi:hypothetical protein
MCLAHAAILLAGLILAGRPTSTRAAENDGADRLDRLEQRVNQIAERQEQLMNRLGSQMQPPAQTNQPDPQNARPGFRAQFRQQLAPASAPLPAQLNPDGARAAKGIHDLIGLLCFIGMICNILLAIWIFTDIRKRGEGSGIFIVLALVAGIPSALIYSLTRIGDRKT